MKGCLFLESNMLPYQNETINFSTSQKSWFIVLYKFAIDVWFKTFALC